MAACLLFLVTCLGAVVSSVVSQQEGCRFDFSPLASLQVPVASSTVQRRVH